MAAHLDEWTSRLAGGLCGASRWIAAPSLALAVFACFAVLVRDEPASLSAALVIVCGLAQTYLSVRVDFDRRIFEAVGQRSDAGYAGLDQALGAMGLRKPSADRTPGERASGTLRLVGMQAAVLVAQFAAVLIGSWVQQ